MAKKQSDQISRLIRDLEKTAKRIRADIRKRATAVGVPQSLESAADQLRKRAAAVAAQVEKRVHQLRKDLESPKKKATKKRAAAKTKPAASSTTAA